MSDINFWKYHATGNDFLIVTTDEAKLYKRRWSKLALAMCHRHRGVGADGLLVLSSGSRRGRKIDIFNADGSWAEKSGNGLRIAGLHTYLTKSRKSRIAFETAAGPNEVTIVGENSRGHKVMCELGCPEFEAPRIPIRSRGKYFVNRPLKVDGVSLSITCLSTGNPHAVMFVDHLDFDWPILGETIENHRMFPNRTNVEFAKIIDRKHVVVAEWERGVGATGSSGTGAAATVAAGVMNGLLERKCRVSFSEGDLAVNWRKADDVIELTGYVNLIGKGVFSYR